MNASIVIAVLFAVVGVALADYPVNITLTLGYSDKSVGKIRVDVNLSKYTQQIWMQEHMQPLLGGQSYSSIQQLHLPIENVTSVNVMWFKKKLAFGSNKLTFQHAILEPLYPASVFEKRMKTKMFCGYTTYTPGKSEYPVNLNNNCRPW